MHVNWSTGAVTFCKLTAVFAHVFVCIDECSNWSFAGQMSAALAAGLALDGERTQRSFGPFQHDWPDVRQVVVGYTVSNEGQVAHGI